MLSEALALAPLGDYAKRYITKASMRCNFREKGTNNVSGSGMESFSFQEWTTP